MSIPECVQLCPLGSSIFVLTSGPHMCDLTHDLLGPAARSVFSFHYSTTARFTTSAVTKISKIKNTIFTFIFTLKTVFKLVFDDHFSAFEERLEIYFMLFDTFKLPFLNPPLYLIYRWIAIVSLCSTSCISLLDPIFSTACCRETKL